MDAPWKLERGANLTKDGVTFAVWAPFVQTLEVEFPVDGRPALPLKRDEETGVFHGEARDLEPEADYILHLGQGRRRPDPVSRFQARGVDGASRIVNPAFSWTDAGWPGVKKSSLIIYELHVGTFSVHGGFAGVIEQLPYLYELGVTAIELMPVAQFPGARNWGYDGVLPYAPQNTYGGPDGLKTLVDEAHRTGLGVILDVVYNHLGPEGNYLSEFGPYFTDKYHTPWGEAINFDGPGSDEVRRYFVDNALYWISEYHLDGLRLDAVHAIYDFSAYHILQEISERVHELGRAIGRQTLVIAESDLNDPRIVADPEKGGYGLDAQWSDDFHHAVHALLTGEQAGYYMDFGGLHDLSRAISARFVNGGRYSRYRKRRHGAPAHGLPADRFVVFNQNHDQIGNRAVGDRLSTIVSFEQQKLAAALLFLSPYIPLLFMGEEYGETNPFLYFVDFGDSHLVQAVRNGRKAEFEAFGWKEELPDPKDETTLKRSKPDREKRNKPSFAQLYLLNRELINLKLNLPVLIPGQAAANTVEGPTWLRLHYANERGETAFALFNMDKGDSAIEVPAAAGAWRRVIYTEESRFQAEGGRIAEAQPPDKLFSSETFHRITLAGYSAVLYAGVK